jgi:hypothetical protein
MRDGAVVGQTRLDAGTPIERVLAGLVDLGDTA